MEQTFTIAEVAKASGVTKRTAIRRAHELGIFDSMPVVDARGTRAMTAEQASALSNALTKSAPEQLEAIQAAADLEQSAAAVSSLVNALQQVIDEKDRTIQRLEAGLAEVKAELSRTELAHQSKLDELDEQIAGLQQSVDRWRSYAEELRSAHWWQKKAVVARYALPPAQVS